MNTLQDRVKEAIAAGFTNAQLSEAAGVTSGAVSQWLSGQTQTLRASSATGLARLTGWSAAWWAEGRLPKIIPSSGTARPAAGGPVAGGYVRLPIMAEAAAGAGRNADAIELVEHVDVAESWVRQTLKANPGRLQVLTARGHSMTGLIEDGDVLFVEPCVDFREDGVYIISVEGLIRVKRLRVRIVDRMLSIESNDGSQAETVPLVEVGEAVRICGRVVGAWSLRRL